MNKRGGSEKQMWVEFMQALFLAICLFIFVPFFLGLCSQIKQAAIQDRNVETFDILTGYLDQLRVNERATQFPLKFDSHYVVRVLKRCKTQNEMRGVDCAVEPRICLVDTKNTKIAPHCHQLQGGSDEIVDFSMTEKNLPALHGFRIIKRDVESGKIESAQYTEITIGVAAETAPKT